MPIPKIEAVIEKALHNTGLKEITKPNDCHARNVTYSLGERLIMRVFALALVATLSAMTSVWAAQDEAIYQQLMQARSLKCVFVTGSQATWDRGRLAMTTINDEKFVLNFDSIDAKAETARLIGDMGSADVVILSTPRHLTFIEKTPTGNINITAVFPSYKINTQEFVSTTSRHLYFPNVPGGSLLMISQQHGTCQVWK